MVLIVIAALLFQRSATAPWVEARGADGRRLQVSPIGLADYGLGTSGTAPVECRWWPKLGPEELCAVAPAGASRMAWVRRAYPLTVIALWTCVLALFLVALRIPRQLPVLGTIATTIPPALGVLALWAVAVGSNRALGVLAGLPLHPLFAGFGSMVAAIVLTATAALLLVLSGRPRRE